MGVDWHYYLLIAPHSCSSPFEDQSVRGPLCVPTLINPEWTSIKPTVHFVHLSLLTPFPALRVEKLLNWQSQPFTQRKTFQYDYSKEGRGVTFKCSVVQLATKPSATCLIAGCLNLDMETWQLLCWLQSSSVNFRHYSTQRMNERKIQVTWLRNRWGGLWLGDSNSATIKPLGVEFPQVSSMWVSYYYSSTQIYAHYVYCFMHIAYKIWM